ncbi:protein AGENET DOMAIN (AGD)-CONTAINING P1-like [Solanum dulcamara]|uniref:protein AGENET DOMAIN (AGD)-CONTAINING P1-like n=1 Tax=Solanum dulcamara TaxID=45834 RepID=UPI0024855CD0|nr:protein AGENET DOMAIN (AGD)-CONTAINING P1-like [Solanum dulcamara]
MVDVFVNDGWWFGFINGKTGEEYNVYFPTTADNITYSYDVLRFHQELSNKENKENKAAKLRALMRMTLLLYPQIVITLETARRFKCKNLLTDDESEPLEDVVATTEVYRVPLHQCKIVSENRFHLYDMVDVFVNDGWWFGFINGKTGEEIKCKNLLTDDESEPLEDVVATIEVYPIPLHQCKIVSENRFRLYDMVDVFFNDGWWFGFINGKTGEEYYVYFSTTADNITYSSDVLRFHQELSNKENKASF